MATTLLFFFCTLFQHTHPANYPFFLSFFSFAMVVIKTDAKLTVSADMTRSDSRLGVSVRTCRPFIEKMLKFQYWGFFCPIGFRYRISENCKL